MNENHTICIVFLIFSLILCAFTFSPVDYLRTLEYEQNLNINQQIDLLKERIK